MSAVSQCILDAVEAGLINEQKGREISNLLEEAEQQRIRAGDPQSVAEVAPRVLQAMQERARRRRKNIATQTMVQRRIEALVDEAPTTPETRSTFEWFGAAIGAADSVKARIKGVLAPNFAGGFSSLNLQRAVDIHRGRMHERALSFLERFRSRAGGLAREKAGLRPVVRELYGEDTGNQSAKALSRGLREALHYDVDMKRRYGSEVAEIENYVPQRHDPTAVSAASEDEWIDFVMPRLDRQQMVNERTGLPMTDDELVETLRTVHRDITTGNAHKINPDGFVQTSLLKRMERSRRLHFRDADAWLEYNDRFGTANGDIFSMFTGHFDAAARDIAQLQVLGPMPAATIRFMEKLGNKRLQADGQAGFGHNELQNLYDTVTGAVNVAGAGARSKWAGGFAATRSVLLSGVLGGAFLSSLGDMGFSRMASRMTGVPYTRVAQRHLSMFNPSNEADRRMAVRLGLTAQGWASHAIAGQRILGEVMEPGLTTRILDTTLRLSLLSPWTEAGRWGFGTELLGFMTEQAGRQFDELPDMLRNAFSRHGLSPDDWEAIRAAPRFVDPDTGAEFIRAEEVFQSGAAGPADRLQAMIMQETEAAIPTSTAATRSVLLAGQRPGTVMGEILRGAALLKSFPVSVMHVQMQRMAAQQSGANGMKYAAHLVAGTAMMGMLGEQMSRVSQGKHPGRLDDLNLWEDVMWRAGAFGLVGDVLFTNVNRTKGLTNALIGPSGQLLDQSVQLTLGNVKAAARGENINFDRDLRRFTELMLPGNRLWYGRLAFERLFLDEMQKLSNPRAGESFDAIVQSAKGRGETYWAPPGEGITDRSGRF